MVSIVIPIFNQHDMTDECITAIRETTQDCEIIMIDNGSTPPIHKPFAGFIDVTLIRNEENRGFPVAINQGVAAAKGDIIIALNNDVIVTPGWVNTLTSVRADIVGPVTNYCAGVQRVQIGTYNSKEDLYRESQAWAEQCRGEVQEVSFIIGFCMMFKKSLFEELGGFDESLWPCSGEEIDFCLSARAGGYKVAVAMDCYVHHEGSVTFTSMDNAGILKYDEICKRNDKYLAEKWGTDFGVQQCVTVEPPKGLMLNLGCGYDHIAGYVNIDNRPETAPDMVADVLSGLPYDDNSVDGVRAYDFLEHIPIGRQIDVITDIWRVLKPGGIFESLTPSTDGRGAFQDPFHLSFWNQNSWLYYSDPETRHLYNIKADFEIIGIEDTVPDPAWMIIHTHVIAKKRGE